MSREVVILGPRNGKTLALVILRILREREMHIFGKVGDVSKAAWVELRLMEWERFLANKSDTMIWPHGPGELRLGCEWYLDQPDDAEKYPRRAEFKEMAKEYLDSVAEEYQS